MNSRFASPIAIGAYLVIHAASASAGPCGDQIAKVEHSLKQHSGAVGTAPQSIAAQLEHQPTPASVNRAEEHAKGEVERILAEAKKLDAQGEQGECDDALAKARIILSP
jgi:hypothetical protein